MLLSMFGISLAKQMLFQDNFLLQMSFSCLNCPEITINHTLLINDDKADPQIKKQRQFYIYE